MKYRVITKTFSKVCYWREENQQKQKIEGGIQRVQEQFFVFMEAYHVIKLAF